MKTITNYISNEKISSLDEYITEKLKIGKTYKQEYTCHPKDKNELKTILTQRLANDKNANLNDIDVSEIEDMYSLFSNLDPHNIDISDWNVSNVKNMAWMFAGCKNFNCDLSDWDVSNVKYMGYMFHGCVNLDCDLSNWDVSNVETSHMFAGCTAMKNKPSWYKY